jgi:DoxX-like family
MITTILGWLLTVVVAYFLGKGGFDKVRGTDEMKGNFAFMKLDNYRVAIGLAELVAVVLLIVPSTTLYGAVMIISLMSGAAALHLSLMGGNKTYLPVLIGIAALLVHSWR